MNELTKEEINNISKKISDIYQKVFGNEHNIGNIEWIKSDVNMLCKQLKDIKINLENQLTIAYDNGGNEIDPEVNLLRRQIQEIDNLEEDIIPDLLFGIEDRCRRKNPEQAILKEKTNQEEVLNISIPENFVQEDEAIIEVVKTIEIKDDNNVVNKVIENTEQESEVIIEVAKKIEKTPEITGLENVNANVTEKSVQENNDIIEITPKIEEVSETIKKQPELEIKDVYQEIEEVVVQIKEPIKTLVQDESTVLAEKKENITIKLGRPSNDYKYIAENIVNVRNCSLPEPSRAIEEGAVASEQIIENIKNILMKDI